VLDTVACFNPLWEEAPAGARTIVAPAGHIFQALTKKNKHRCDTRIVHLSNPSS
jgi:hypothetical protein